MLLARLRGPRHLALPLFLLLIQMIHAAPISDIEHTKYSAWESAPNKRGSLTILFSCGAAFTICVWTSLHLNVMPIEQSQRESQSLSAFLGKTVWASIGLLAPDFILTVALHQLLVAREYQNYVNKKLETSPSSFDVIRKSPSKAIAYFMGRGDPEPKKGYKTPMSLEVAYFATMGGFAIDVHNVGGTRRLTVRILDLNQLVMIDRIHDFPIREIKDKSKATAFAKTVACVQTGWILLQCFGRQYAGLHVTLLEMNTAVHVIIAILIYAIWWKKPADISRPIVILQKGVPHSAVELYNSELMRRIQCVGRVLEEGLNEDGVRSNSGPPRTAPKTQPKRQEGDEVRTAWTQIRAQTFKKCIEASIPDSDNRATYPDPRGKLAMALLACRIADTVPEKAKELVGLFPKAIRKYLRKSAKRDIASAVLQEHRRIGKAEIHKDILAAARSAAFDEANRIAFKAASTKIRGGVLELIKSGSSHSKSEGYSEELLYEVLERVQETIRKRTFQKAYRAAFKAAITASADVETSAGIETAADAKTSATGDNTTDSGPMGVFRATHQAASAATRMASREAVRLAALDEALGKGVSAEAAGKAFQAEFSEIIDTKDGNSFHPNALKYVKEKGEHIKKLIQESVLEKFYEQFHGNLRVDLGTDANVTANYVELGAYAGIRDAIAELLSDVKKSNVNTKEWEVLCKKAKLELASLDAPRSDKKKPKSERLRGSLRTGGAVLTDQLFAVPGLLGKEIPRLGKIIPRLFKGDTEVPKGDPKTPEGSPKTPKDGSATSKDEPEFFSESWQVHHRVIIFIFSASAALFYGGIHATKWNSQWFATNIERILWQASCVISTTAFIPAMHLFLLGRQGCQGRIAQFVILFSFLLTITLFFVARTYLVFESFISLRYLPLDAFESVAWSEAIPHL